MAAREATLISGEQQKADEKPKASAIEENVELQQVVDIGSSEQMQQEPNNNNNNNNNNNGAAKDENAPQELKKPTNRKSEDFVGDSEVAGKAVSSLQSSKLRKSTRDQQKNVADEDKEEKNGFASEQLRNSVLNLAQSSRDKKGEHRAEVANDTNATQSTNSDKISRKADSNLLLSQEQKSSSEHTVIECGDQLKPGSDGARNNPIGLSSTTNTNCTSIALIPIDQTRITRTLDEATTTEPAHQETTNIKPEPKLTTNQKCTTTQTNNLAAATTKQQETIATPNLNHNTFSANKLEPEQEFGCKRRRLSYLQSLLLRKWPCLAIGICIMSSLLFGMLLSALTVYLMHGVTDCSSYALAAAARASGTPLMAAAQHERPSDFSDTPIELASLTGSDTSGNKLYAAGTLPGSNSTSSTTTTGDGTKSFRRLPGTLWPVHYDLFVQPYIAEPFNFTGKVSIRIKCSEATDNITLHSNDMELNEKTLSLKLAGNGSNSSAQTSAKLPKVKGLSSVKELQYSIIQLDAPLEAGQEYVLGIDFVGWLNDDLAGFYKIKYEQQNSSEPTWIAATQFQATDARRAFPCFDEPLYKATFSIQIKHWKNMTALSNMPIIDRQESPDGLWVTDTFSKTHRMSTYLVAYAVTNFESRTEGNISVWARPGFAHSAEYSLKIAGKILRHYEDFFGIEYPLPKMDMIALPDFNAGAMENWGLITYRETAMLYDEQTSSIANKQRVAVVVAHELAHQWFGNLVTPKWWDDLWLNEGFASYVEYIGVDFVEPGWRMLDQFVVEEVQNVFKVDGLSTSHQISIPVNNPDEISEIFDHISYAKGASIIRMMNHFLTQDVFKAGLRRYLRALKYNNAEQSDLWAHLTEAQRLASKIKASGELPLVNVQQVMNSWTLQTGYPLVTLTRSYDNSKQAKLEQVRYEPYKWNNKSNSAADLQKLSSSSNQRWEIPITFTWQSEQNWEPSTRLWMHQNQSAPVELSKDLVPKSNDEWMLLNVGQVGYYRVNYDLRNWKMLINQLNSDHKLITTTNRAQILDDVFELARSGLIDYKFAMEATKYLISERDYLPWDTVLMSFAYIDEMLSRTSLYGDWREYIADIIGPYYARYKDSDWTLNSRTNNKSSNSNNLLEIYNQVNAISWACQVIEDCQQKARVLFNRWKQTGKNQISPELRFTVYCSAIENGNRSDWDFLWRVYESEQTASERDRIMRALGCTKEIWLLARYLEWTFDKTKPIRRQDGAFVFRMIAKNNYGHDIAFNFMRDKWSVIKEYYGKTSFSLGNLIRSIATSMNTQIELNELLSFYESIKNDVGTGRRSFQNAIEEVESNVLWKNRYYKIIEEWLREEQKKKQQVAPAA